MPLDETRLRDTLQSLHPKLTIAEVGAIVDVARLAASIDGKMDLAEMSTVARLSRILYAMAGAPGQPVPTEAPGPQRLHEIGRLLEATGPRELAFAAAVLVMHIDRKVTTEEADLRRRLAGALLLGAERAKALDDQMAALVRAG